MYDNQTREYTCKSPGMYMKRIGRNRKESMGIVNEVEVHVYYGSGLRMRITQKYNDSECQQANLRPETPQECKGN